MAETEQRDIFGYGEMNAPPTAAYRVASARAGSDTEYIAELFPHRCRNAKTGEPCQGFQYNGDCIHIQRALNIHLLRTSQYLKTRFERRSKAHFPDFEAVMAHFEFSRNPEIEYLAALFLGLLFTGPNTTDALYEAVEGRTRADPRIFGVITRALTSRGLIKRGKWVAGIRQQDHYARKPLYMITAIGRDALMGVYS